MPLKEVLHASYQIAHVSVSNCLAREVYIVAP
nr:MAG TPA: hypothetical protein [Caudoviricetes sp.]